jgi:hypothetical protein
MKQWFVFPCPLRIDPTTRAMRVPGLDPGIDPRIAKGVGGSAVNSMMAGSCPAMTAKIGASGGHEREE